jgi:hypothetical protein
MSQHYFDTSLGDEPITVMLGWDRPLQGYFMLIESTQRDGYIYSNLEDIDLVKCGGFASSLDYFIDKMRELGVVVCSAARGSGLPAAPPERRADCGVRGLGRPGACPRQWRHAAC